MATNSSKQSLPVLGCDKAKPTQLIIGFPVPASYIYVSMSMNLLFTQNYLLLSKLVNFCFIVTPIIDFRRVLCP